MDLAALCAEAGRPYLANFKPPEQEEKELSRLNTLAVKPLPPLPLVAALMHPLQLAGPPPAQQGGQNAPAASVMSAPQLMLQPVNQPASIPQVIAVVGNGGEPPMAVNAHAEQAVIMP